MNSYDQGVPVICAVLFTDPATGQPVDPDTINFVSKTQDGTFVRATYTKAAGDPTATILRTAPGAYQVRVSTSAASGDYLYRFYSPEGDTYETSVKGAFYVDADLLV